MTGREQHTPVDTDGRAVGDGRYVLQSLLGEGGMARVYLGHDSVLDRPVAVKLLRSDLAEQESFQLRFTREAKAVARLNHVNIVSVFDSGEDTGRGAPEPFIVMEYVEGCSLRELLDQHVAHSGAMPLALRIAIEVLAALAESHARGLIHRDVKPSNVMMTRRHSVKVMDFGIARATHSGLGSMTQTGMVVGTPQYLSPEQALGQPVDERSDLYSVSCMLFEMVPGRLPFSGDSALGIAYQHVQTPAPTPSQCNPSLPASVDRLLAVALSKEPAKRYQSAEAMREAAAALLADTEPEKSGSRPGAGAFGPAPAVGRPYTPTVTASPYSSPGPGMPNAVAGPASTAVRHPPHGGPSAGGDGPQDHGRSAAPVRRKAWAWGGFATATLAVGLLAVPAVGGGEEEGAPGRGRPARSAPTAAASATVSAGDVVVGDVSLRMPVKDCTAAEPSRDGKISVPWFKLHHIDSVRACAKAGGWKLTEKMRNETL
ncbi:protein kinase [Streptomyces sp. WSLK1-3]|uniref:protein kinase domain-containing protein n=1 Tax=Streptomyces sp. WSLK1-3 TaxID=3375475 RepID=UPI0037AE5D6C